MSDIYSLSNINRIIRAINRANYFLDIVVDQIAQHCPVANDYACYSEIFDENDFSPVNDAGTFRIHTSCKLHGQIITKDMYISSDYLTWADDVIVLDVYHHELEKIQNIIIVQQNYHENELKKLHAGSLLVESYMKKSIAFDK